MKTSTRIVLLIIFVIIVAVGVTAGVMFLNNRDSNTEKENEGKELSWEEEFVAVLKDEENFAELKDLQISLTDLDQDETPELVVFCSNAINEFIANIYQIKDKKVEKKEVTFDEKFNIEYVYNQDNEECNWYFVTENSNDMYEIKLDDKENITADSKIENKGNLISIGKTTKTEFNKTTEETKVKESLETAKNKYLSNAEIKKTEEAILKIEGAKILRNVKKIDNTKGLVYSAREYETDNYANVIDKTFHNYYEYPAINIDSEDAKAINEEIKEKYGFTKEQEEELFFMELEVITYDYYINDKILSVVVMEGGNDSTWTSSYNIDIETGKRISNEDLIARAMLSSSKKLNLDTNVIKEKLKEYGIAQIDKSATEMKKAIGQYWDATYETEVTKLKEEVSKNLETLENVYMNEEGIVCCRSRYQIFGGQYTCTKTIEIDTSNDTIKEIKFEDYLKRGLGNQNK